MKRETGSGVYEIRCLTNGHRYIGSSFNIHRRWLGHLSQLRRGIHHSQKLQRAWAKHGADAFCFSVLELCPTDSLCSREDSWMRQLSSEYNVKPNGTPGWSGMRHTDEAKAKISQHMRTTSARENLAKLHAAKLGVPRTADVIEKMRVSKLGSKHTPETIAKLKKIASESGYRHSDETRARMSAGRKGKQLPPEAIEKMRKTLTGRKRSPEHIEKTAAALRGRARPQSVRDRISAAKLAKFAERKANGIPAFKSPPGGKRKPRIAV